MKELDPFLVNYHIERLLELNQALLQKHEDYVQEAEKENNSLKIKISELENTNNAFSGTVNSLTTMISDLSKVVESLNGELIDTKLTNIKQEMVTRTLLNMNQYEANDMYVDTFTTADGIDWGTSIRGEWFDDLRAIGRTTASTVYVKQETASSKLLLTGNAGDDNAVCQSFTLDKTQDIDKISLRIEKHQETTWKPLLVKITDDLAGINIITEGSIDASVITEDGWYDVELNNIQLTKYTEYYITIYTEDTYGYRIGQHTSTDTYFVGTSYIKFSNVWTDNNYDIAFKVWCYAAADEDNATIITTVHEYEGELQTMVFDAESVTYSGSINFFVSCNDGADWKILEPGLETSLLDLPSTNKVRIKTYIDGNSRVDAWGYVIKRGEKA